MEILGEYGLLVHFSSALVPLGDALQTLKSSFHGDFYAIVGTGVLDCPYPLPSFQIIACV
ncbi:MAG: hypothetical protein IJC80_02720 [Clostridia bacterium]|nr:hypothetical protein [Clostridia bacterium]